MNKSRLIKINNLTKYAGEIIQAFHCGRDIGDGKYDDQWIYNYRGYRSPEFKRKLEILMRAMNKNSQGFATEDLES